MGYSVIMETAASAATSERVSEKGQYRNLGQRDFHSTDLHFGIPSAKLLDTSSSGEGNPLRDMDDQAGRTMLAPFEEAAAQLEKTTAQASSEVPWQELSLFGNREINLAMLRIFDRDAPMEQLDHGMRAEEARRVVEDLHEAAIEHPNGVFRVLP